MKSHLRCELWMVTSLSPSFILLNYFQIRFGNLAFFVRGVPGAILVLLKFPVKNDEPIAFDSPRVKDSSDHSLVNAFFGVSFFFYNHFYIIIFFHL